MSFCEVGVSLESFSARGSGVDIFSGEGSLLVWLLRERVDTGPEAAGRVGETLVRPFAVAERPRTKRDLLMEADSGVAAGSGLGVGG